MKTAVILAARKERDSEVPYPLLPFNGEECLLDRTLNILNDLAYDHIFIVCGYEASRFEHYNSDRVKVLYNKDYAFTASMASLAVAADELEEDFLLLEGDTFYERKVIEQLSQTAYSDCLAITEESGNGDEAFVETHNGFVTKISKDRHQMIRFDGEMLGLMRISLSTFHKMMALWKVSENSALNYEYLFFDATTSVGRPCIFFRNLIWGDVDTKEDFHKLKNYIYPKLRRKENPFDLDNLKAHMQTIFPERNADAALFTQIGGLSNKNFKVEMEGEKYVLRVPGNGSEGMVNRSFEEENSFKASNLGVNPPVRYFNSKTGIKLVDFIKGAETLNGGTIQRHDNLRQVAQILKTLHTSKIRFNNDFNVFLEILSYEKLLEQAGGKMYEGYDRLRADFFALEEKLNAYGVSLKPCHNDLVAENFVKSDNGQIYLIDWEYSGMNDPLWEFAALFVENDFSEESQDYFLHQYYGDAIPEHTREKITIYIILQDVLWSIWTCIKEAAGDDFGSYGPDRYDRAKRLLKTIE